jgi:hypothetical protein
MSVLMEWYDSGSAPHEALGRAARKLARGGALYVGGGIGAEKRSTPKGDEYNVASAAGATTETFTGPLTAAMRAYALAGASTEASTPGGSTTIADPAVAARVAELSERLRSIDDDVARYQRRLARSAARKQAQPYSPVNSGGGVSVADDDAWEQRRIDELRVEQQQVEAERAMLLAGGGLSEVEQARPGTNFTKIPAANVSKLRPIIDHYKGMAHPFTACVRDQVKHGLSADHAKRRCAVVKDLGAGTTKWRKGGGKSGKIAEALLTEALERVEAVQEAVGVVAMVQLVECGASVEAGRTSRELVEMLTDDFALLAWAEHPLGLLVFPEVAEAGFDEKLHPRGKHGQFRAKIAGLSSGAKAEVAPGVHVTKVARGTPSGTGHVFTVRGKGRTMEAGDVDEAVGHVLNLTSAGRPPSSGATRQAAIANRRVRVPGGTATRQEATAASRDTPGSAKAHLDDYHAKVARFKPEQRQRMDSIVGAVEKAIAARGSHSDSVLPQGWVLLTHVHGQGGTQVKATDLTDLVRMGVLEKKRTKSGMSYRVAPAAKGANVRKASLAKMGLKPLGEAESSGIGMLLEGFSSSSGAGGVGTRPDLRAQRQVKRAQQAGTLKTPTSKRAKPSKPSGSSSSGGSDSSKHPRGRTGTPEGGRFVSKGSSGEDVRAVQRKVGASPDGKFGPKTAAAVRQFQQAHGLQVDGVVGRQTALAMRGHIETARKTAPGAMHAVDHAALKTMRRGTKGRSGKVGPRRRGGVVV